jgi:hypothetical protein
VKSLGSLIFAFFFDLLDFFLKNAIGLIATESKVNPTPKDQCF